MASDDEISNLTENTKEFIESRKKYLNFSDLEFISAECKAILNLVNGNFKKFGHNRHCKILLGQKVIGKTTLTRYLQEFFSSKFKNLIIVYIDYEIDTD